MIKTFTILLIIIQTIYAIPYIKNNNNDYTCCVTPTNECKSALIGSCISCALAETIAEAFECAMKLAEVSNDCIECSTNECYTCPTYTTFVVPNTTSTPPSPSPSPDEPKCHTSITQFMCNIGNDLKTIADDISKIIDDIGPSDTTTVQQIIPQEGFKQLTQGTNCFIGFNNSFTNWNTWPTLMVREYMSYVNQSIQDNYVRLITDMAEFTGGFDVNSQGLTFFEGSTGEFHNMFMNLMPIYFG